MIFHKNQHHDISVRLQQKQLLQYQKAFRLYFEEICWYIQLQHSRGIFKLCHFLLTYYDFCSEEWACLIRVILLQIKRSLP